MTRPTPESEAALIAYIQKLEAHRERIRGALRGPTSSLAAIARHELPVGATLRIGPNTGDVVLPGMPRDVVVRATEDGFVVDGAPSGPTNIDAGRYNLRLSHQNYPAVVILDRESPHLSDDVERRWWPIDPALRIRARVEPDGTRGSIGSTASSERAVERVGWIRFTVDRAPVRMLLTRLLEPGSAQVDVYFRDGTTGHGSYEVGRYVDVESDGEEVIVDFNFAYNPACALSPYYNCPIPPIENRIDVPIRAGEMSPLVSSEAAHR